MQPRISAALDEAQMPELRARRSNDLESNSSPSSNQHFWKWIERIAWICVITAAIALRFYKLDQPIMWCDEAESCINAMTILQHGVPTDTYLGLPIFENALSEKWPGNAEYEFRDSSYTKSGVTVYHGWLPLYSIAASFKAFGILPATDATNLRASVTPNQIKWRSIAARTPESIFGVMFCVLAYLTAKEMHGKDAAWGALIATALASPVIHLARQARYYSLTVMLSMACCLFIWRIVKRGLWRDYFCAAITASLLFHTHALTFAIVCIASLTILPFVIRQNQFWLKLAIAAIIVAIAVVPWGILSGFFSTATSLPPARQSLDLPKDLFIYALDHWPLAIFMVIGSAWILAVKFLGHRMPARLAAPFSNSTGACAFLIGWCLIGWLVFMLMIPAVSLWLTRAYLGMIGPGIVLASILFAASARVLGRRSGWLVGGAMLLAFVYANSRGSYSWAREPERTARMTEVIDHMRDWNLRPNTRVYSTPNDHLTITFYTDVPVQSIAPIRREFLNSFPNDLVIIEAFSRMVPIGADEVLTTARANGVSLTTDESQSWADRLTVRGVAESIRPRVAGVNVPLDPLPVFAEQVLQHQRNRTMECANVIDNPVRENPAIFRGYSMPDYSWWWQIFFYRFSDLAQRTGDHLNYYPRLRSAHATILPGMYTVYLCPGSGPRARD